MRTLIALSLLVLGLGTANAEVRVHHIFDNNIVLQRGKPLKVWGWADKGEVVSVEFHDQKVQTEADDQGTWAVELRPPEASAEGRRLIVRGTANTVEYENVVVGDVWLCGGQSNMEDVLEDIYHGDVEVASAHHPLIRLMTIPVKATPDRQDDFERIDEFNSWTGRHEKKGSWFVCSPDTVNRFSAIGYILGRRIHLVSRVPCRATTTFPVPVASQRNVTINMEWGIAARGTLPRSRADAEANPHVEARETYPS